VDSLIIQCQKMRINTQNDTAEISAKLIYIAEYNMIV